MGVSFDKIDGLIWYDGALVPCIERPARQLGQPFHWHRLDLFRDAA